MNLHEACCAVLVDRTVEDPCAKIRAMLLAYARVLAARRPGGRAADWAVYVEPHIAGVRFILHDPRGAMVDLERLPADPEELLS